MIKTIHIENFKSIENMDVPLDRINILVGGNNSGKTSILQAIQFGCSITQTLYLIANKKWTSKPKFTRTIDPQELVYSPLKDVQALARGGQLKQSKNGKDYSIHIGYEDDINQECKVEIRRGTQRNIIGVMNINDLTKQFAELDKPMCMFVPGIAGIPYNEEFKSEGIVRKAAAKGDANNVIRNVLWLLRQDNDEWNTFLAEFKTIFPNLGIKVSFDKKVDDYIDVRIIEQKEGNEGESSLPLDAAGTGVLQAIQILSYISVYHPKILILDEPDAHLHPNNQRKILKYIFELAEEKDFQIIISTHSRHVVDMAKESANLMWIKDGEIIQEDSDNVRMLLEIGALDRGDMLKNGLVKYVFLTEDSTDENMINAILKSAGANIQEVDVWSYAGCSKVDAAIALANFIKDNAPLTKVIIHRDRDYMFDPEVEDYKERVLNSVDYCFVTKNVDIEAYFLDAEFLHEKYGDKLSVEEAQELIDKVTEVTKEYSIETFINSRIDIANRNRNKEPEKRVNTGKVARECREIYESNPVRYRHGKKTLKALKSVLQQEKKLSIDGLISNSEFVCDYDLSAIFKDSEE